MSENVGQEPAVESGGTTAMHLTSTSSYRCQEAAELPWRRTAGARYIAVTDRRTDEDDPRSRLRIVYAPQGGSNDHPHKTCKHRSTHYNSVTDCYNNKCQQISAGPSTPVSRWAVLQLVVHLTWRRHLQSAASDVQRTATAIGRRNFAVFGPETWNSLPAELRLSTLSINTFARRLKAHLFVSTKWYVPAARLILLKAALFLNIIIIIIIIIIIWPSLYGCINIAYRTYVCLFCFCPELKKEKTLKVQNWREAPCHV